MKDASRFFSDIDERLVKKAFEHTVSSKLHRDDPLNTCAMHVVQQIRSTWDDAVVVFTAGVFDILHTSHLLALTHYRLLGAKEYLHLHGNDAPTLKELQDVAASDHVRLIVSVDTDVRVAQDKAFLPEKGASPKPLVSWENRVLLLGRQYILGTNAAHDLIDFVTKHGPDACKVHNGCAQDDNATIAASIKPDIVVVSSGSPKTIALLHAQKELAKSKLVVIEEQGMAYYDKLLGGPIKSSAIIKRARSSQQAANPTPLSANTAFG